MMRGPAYDDSYLSRKMGGLQLGPPLPSYHRTTPYLQRWLDYSPSSRYYYYPRRASYVYYPSSRTTREDWYLPTYSSRLRYRSNWDLTYPYRSYLDPDIETSTTETVTVRRSLSPSPTRVIHSTVRIPSAQTKLILNRVAMTPVRAPLVSVRTPLVSVRPSIVSVRPSLVSVGPSVVSTVVSSAGPAAPVGYLPPPRLPPRYAPSYYDYDYGYGGYSSPYAGYGMYGGYLGGGYTPLPTVPSRLSRYDSYLDDDYEVSYPPRYRPGGLTEAEKDKIAADTFAIRARSCSPPPSTTTSLPYRLVRYSSPVTTTRTLRSSSPHMLQDQVDKMRIRLKALAYSLDPSGPVPEIVVPTRSKKSSDADKSYYSGPKHFACVEFAGPAPQWKRKARARFPTEDPDLISKAYRTEIELAEEAAERDPEKLVLKDKLSMKIHNYFSNNLSPEKFEKYLKTYRAPGTPKPPPTLPDYSSKYSSRSLSRWEEPDTVYGPSTDRKPYSKTEGGDDEERKERRKKKKSRERDELSSTDLTAVIPESSSQAAVSSKDDSAAAPSEEAPAVEAEAEPELDDKEKKRLEKKKRKAEREAAAKAAMEAELEALATAELELARLEQESASLQSGEAPATDAVAATEEAAEKCEFSERDQVASEPCDPEPLDPMPSVSKTEEVIAQNEFQSEDLDQGSVPLADSETPQPVTVEVAPEGCGDSTHQEGTVESTWGEEQQGYDEPPPSQEVFEAIPTEETEVRGGEDNVIGDGVEEAWIAAAAAGSEAAAVDGKVEIVEPEDVQPEQQTAVEVAEESITAAAVVEEQQPVEEESGTVTTTATEDSPWEDVFANRDE